MIVYIIHAVCRDTSTILGVYADRDFAKMMLDVAIDVPVNQRITFTEAEVYEVHSNDSA